jgi:hypothetical protein
MGGQSFREPGLRGRKPKHDTRETEIRARLAEWKQMPEFSRPSLRALARELGTSHQLLVHYLKRLEKWQGEQYFRQAREILARVEAENRVLTPWEEQQAYAWHTEAVRAMVVPSLLDSLDSIKQDAKRGPLHPAQFKMLKIFARQGFSGAHELIEKCLRLGLKKKKPFAEIVRETPRGHGETMQLWVRRIWDRCEDYDTKCPTVLTEELLEKLSQEE